MTSVLLFHAVSDRTWFDDVVVWLKRRYAMLCFDSLLARCAGDQEVRDACYITVMAAIEHFTTSCFPCS